MTIKAGVMGTVDCPLLDTILLVVIRPAIKRRFKY